MSSRLCKTSPKEQVKYITEAVVIRGIIFQTKIEIHQIHSGTHQEVSMSL